MKMFSRVLSIAFACGSISCQSPAPKLAATTKEPEVMNRDVNYITQEEASQRSARVSNVHYQLQIDLTQGEKNFKGEMKLQFQLADTNSDLKVDLTDAQIWKLMINKTEVKDFVSGKRYFMLPQKSLKVGGNEIILTYIGTYSHSGEGLHRFQDPEDKRVYLYTQFEAFDANRFMPCFDQPDLKAKLQLSVLAPKRWTVISNTLETSKKRAHRKAQKWVFPETPLISTYLYALHAGEYKSWTSSFQKIPLRLFARQSLAKYVKPEDWFRVTKQGLGYYQNYFAYDYPFQKYDQVIAPEFNGGAMENVGAVTFSERMVIRGREPFHKKAGTAETILHEMAHMWFGDLVTMKWWNDLWLNESFADYMESLAAPAATEFKDAQMDTFSYSKQSAYLEDQLITTHPIEASVQNTDESFTNFDGITYGKGSATFKQLSYAIGADTFRKGVQNYFQKYAYKNTQRKDFMAELSAVSNQDLDAWGKAWLQDAGVDTLKYRLNCNVSQKVTSLDLEMQSPQVSKQTRSHAFEIAFINDQFKVGKSFRVVMTKKNMSVTEAIGLDCPKMIYPNYRDNDYMKFQLDEVTIANLKTSFGQVEDPFLRLMMLTSMWHMVRDQQMKLSDYAEIALKDLASETNENVIYSLIASISGGNRRDENCIYFFMPNETEAQRASRAQFVASVEAAYMHNLEAAAAGSDNQLIWFDALSHATETPAGLTALLEILNGTRKIAGFHVDQDRRWAILQQMCQFNFQDASSLVDQEITRDRSSLAQESRLACLASIPNLENKKNWYAQVKNEKTNYSLPQIGQIIRHIFPYQQRDLHRAFADDYFQFVAKSFDRDQEYLSYMSRSMTPRMCDEKSAGRITQFAQSDSKMPAVLVKNLKVAGQEDSRCAKVRAFNSK